MSAHEMGPNLPEFAALLEYGYGYPDAEVLRAKEEGEAVAEALSHPNRYEPSHGSLNEVNGIGYSGSEMRASKYDVRALQRRATASRHEGNWREDQSRRGKIADREALLDTRIAGYVALGEDFGKLLQMQGSIDSGERRMILANGIGRA